VVDATPSGVGRKNKEEYTNYNVKSIFQAGEDLEIADIGVFLSTINYDNARKVNSVRIPSPFAVALARILIPLDIEFGVKRATCTFIRPGSEPMRSYGPIDTIIPEIPYVKENILNEELQRLFPKNVNFHSLFVPSILLAVQTLTIDLEQKATMEKIVELFCKVPRTIMVRGNKGLRSTDAIFEYFRRVVRSSADIYELCTWYEHIEVENCMLKLTQAFDPHCIQTPEIIDAIRALKTSVEMTESFNRTNLALKILNPGVYP